MKSFHSHNNSSISNNNNPFISSIVALYVLIFLYFPHFFLQIIPSPLLISTLILVLLILRLGTSQQITTHVEPESEPESTGISLIRLELETQVLAELEPNDKRQPCPPDPKPQPEIHDEPSPKLDLEVDPKQPGPANSPKSYFEDNFETWVVWTPLEVIYEAYEGEECEDETQNDDDNKNPLLSRYYPESESESESESDTGTESSSGSLDEDSVEMQEEGMFEISIDYGFGDDKRGNLVNKLKKEIEFDEEDNLIEIDISPNISECR